MYCLTLAGAVTILDGPSNATLAAGDGVTFHCRFNGTLDWPLWDIGGTIYYSAHLPAGFQYTEEGLHIPAVWEALNETVITCLFIVHIGGGRLTRIESTPAYLMVYSSLYNGTSDTENQLPTKNQTVITWSDMPTFANVSSLTPVSRTNSTNCSSDDLVTRQCETAILSAREVGKSQ